MKCVVFLAATAIFCQIVSGSSHIRRRRGYNTFENDNFRPQAGYEQLPAWLETLSSLITPEEPVRPARHDQRGHYDMFGVFQKDNGSTGEQSSEEDDKPPPNYGSYGSWKEKSTTPPPPVETITYRPVNTPTSGWGYSWNKRTTTSQPPMSRKDQISICVNLCPVTAEYKPVCGSNNLTYTNPERLECEQRCGVDVQLVKMSSCSSRKTNPKRNKTRQELVACIRRCPLSDTYSPVCGSNNITYESSQRLNCERNCGLPVELVKYAPCVEKKPKPTTTEKTLSKEQQIAACIKTCPVTGEYNPVCGSNNVTYTNPGRLECAQSCGDAVTLVRLTSCSVQESESTTSESTTERTGNKAEQITACIRTCPVTAEYNPVCGSDNVTYTNPGRLECAQSCGDAVKLVKLTACFVQEPKPTTTEKPVNTAEQILACISSCPVTVEYNPVCGSNNVTYVNPGRLECAQNCGVGVQMSRKTSCNAPLTAEEIKSQVTSTVAIVTTTSTTARPYINVNEGGNLNNGHEENVGVNGNNNNNNGINTQVLPLTNKGNDEKKESDGNNGVNKGNNDNSGSKGYNSVNGGNGGSNLNGGEIRENSCNGADNSNNIKKPSVQEVMECMQRCALTSEYNPVCGTDNITYMNPGRLLCSQFCGIDIKVAKFAACSSSNTIDYHNRCVTTCTNPPETVTVPVSTDSTALLAACMDACPASSSYQPVCGTNSITYRNLDKLQCARRCGIDVSLKRKAHCSAPEEEPSSTSSNQPTNSTEAIQECINSCIVGEESFNPLCGSDNVTYNNTQHLICARQCGIDVRMKHISPCSNSYTSATTPTPTTVTDTRTKPGLTTKFTIPPDVLGNIWPEATTPKEKEDSEEFDLDQRVKD